MKNLLRVLAFTLISFSSYAQLPSFPNNTSQGNTSTKHTILGGLTSRGYQIYYVADTAAANLVQYFKFTSDLLIKAGDNLYMRSRDKSRWILIGGNVTGTPPPDIYYGVDSVKYDTASSTLCVWSFGIANCYQISTNAPPNTTGVDSVIVTDNQVCQYVGGVPTCYTITSIVNNNQYITNTYIYSGVDSTTYDSATRTYCVYSNGIANCQIINGTVLPPSSNTSVDSVVVTNNQICSWSGGIATCYTIESVINNNEYITNIINNFIDSSLTTINNPTCAPEWNSGNVVVDSAFVARNTNIVFHINCVEYTVDASVFTVPGSGSLPFYLAIYADTNRNMGWYVGETNPLEIPGILDPQKEILLKVYYIPAFGDTIGGIRTVWVYREGNDNYAYDNKRTVTSTFDSLYTATPFVGNSLRISAMTAGQYFTWDLPASHTPTELTDWSAHLRIASTLPKGVKWQISLYSGNSLATSNSIVITDGAYGYSRTAAGVFQFLSGRLSEFNFILPSYDRIRVTFIGSAAVNTQWDDVRLQADAPPVNVTGFVKTVNNVGGSNIFLKVGDILRLNADSSQYELVDSLSGVTLRTVPTFLKYYVGLVDTCLTPVDIDAKHWTLTLNPNCRGSGTGGNVLAYINGTMVNDSTLRLYRDNGDSSDFVIPGGAGSVSSPIDTTNFVQKATTITINGTAQNLSTNRTWNVGTVTSIAKGFGLLPDGTITTTGTINVDSAVIATRARLINELALKQNLLYPTKSLVLSSDSLTLVNDLTTPGNNKVYGTNALGIRAWQSTAVIDPTGGVTGDVVQYDGSGYILTSVFKEYSFSATYGQSTYTNALLSGKHIRVWREGFLQTTSQASLSGTTVTFSPALSASERVYIESNNKATW